jgi:hypothetical protein
MHARPWHTAAFTLIRSRQVFMPHSNHIAAAHAILVFVAGSIGEGENDRG